jgi:hypothetical protein
MGRKSGERRWSGKAGDDDTELPRNRLTQASSGQIFQRVPPLWKGIDTRAAAGSLVTASSSQDETTVWRQQGPLPINLEANFPILALFSPNDSVPERSRKRHFPRALSTGWNVTCH